uniref:CSON014319 protein n=1 Tax=Culicoides sonorensis TaxID=179676 RepID=A0A336KQ14_CULSO
MSSTHVSLWSTPRNLLKKQKSFIIETPSELVIRKTQATTHRRVLQKQLSVDQNLIQNCNRNWTAANSPSAQNHNLNTNYNNQEQQQRTNEPSGLKIVANNLNNNPNNSNNSNSHHRNKRHHLQAQMIPGKNEKMMMKGKDSRININIFLGQASNLYENDNYSDGEDLLFSDQALTGNQQQQGNSSSTTSGNAKLSAANRRAQFQASRGVETVDTQKQNNRPRINSAPLKALSFDESSKGLIVNKSNKKLRRRRALREFQECDEDSSNESTANDKPPRAIKQINLVPATNGRPRSASSNAGEVETLVSLLSSGGSDSEKEDKEIPTKEAVKTDPLPIIKLKPPPLRKIGKSVSFQDDGFEDVSNNNSNSTSSILVNKELPMSIRSNPSTTMPTKARQSRPHNGLSSSSLFFKELESQSLNIQKPVKDTSSGNSSPIEKEKPEKPDNSPQKDEEPFPDNVQTAKERECYRLYQKMSSMGLNVSFDTVLRGMLTPTELRVIQKKKDNELARQATLELLEAEENEDEKSTAMGKTISSLLMEQK